MAWRKVPIVLFEESKGDRSFTDSEAVMFLHQAEAFIEATTSP